MAASTCRSSTAVGRGLRATTVAIGARRGYTDLNYQDDVESRAVYDLLEQNRALVLHTYDRPIAAAGSR